MPGPVIFRQRIGERDVEGKVWVVARQLLELIIVEHLAQRARSVPEADLTLATQPLELVKDVRAHRGHTGTAADKHHFRVGIFGKELTERTGDRHFVTRLERPDVRRHDTRRCIRHIRWRRGDTHIEHDDALLFRVVSHRVGA